MYGRDLLSIGDLSSDELRRVLETALAFKRDGAPRLLAGRTLALLFEKPSLRTRLSFEQAMRHLGGDCLYLSPQEVGLGTREPVKDVARVLSRYVHAVAARTFLHRTVEELAAWASVPVINALTDEEHPCQTLADLLTVYERKGRVEGLTLAYVGDGNNVASSLALGCGLLGLRFRIAAPPGYGLPPGVLRRAVAYAAASGGAVEEQREPAEAVRGADVVYTDVWTSMGREEEAEQRRRAFQGYQVTAGLMALAAPDALFLHDLPAHRGEEVADEVIEGAQSAVFDQAENRLHAQEAVLALLLGEPGG